MKKHYKKLLATILSAGVIASTISATFVSSASAACDVKVEMVQNAYVMHQFKNNILAVYLPKVGTTKNGRYFNQFESTYYNNVKKAGNYFKSLGFVYENYSALLYYPDNTLRTPYTPDTVFISYTYDDGSDKSNKAGHNYVGNLKGDAISEFGMITIGPVDNNTMNELAYVPDVLAHEYAHLITQQIAGWDRNVRSSSIEAGAIVEAYSDILGELSEETPDWKMGTAAYKNNSNKNKCFRNIKNPQSTVTPNIYRKYYTNYTEFKNAAASSPCYSNDIAYGGSTVLSHAAYLMTQAGLDKDLVAKFWLDSLSFIDDTKPLTMSECRKAVVKAVNKYADETNSSARGRSALISRVNSSFNLVNVY